MKKKHVSLTFSSYNQDNLCSKHDRESNCLNSPSGIPYTLSSWLYIPLNECLNITVTFRRRTTNHSDPEEKSHDQEERV